MSNTAGVFYETGTAYWGTWVHRRSFFYGFHVGHPFYKFSVFCCVVSLCLFCFVLFNVCGCFFLYVYFVSHVKSFMYLLIVHFCFPFRFFLTFIHNNVLKLRLPVDYNTWITHPKYIRFLWNVLSIYYMIHTMLSIRIDVYYFNIVSFCI